jgi:uncharacterized protein (DUF736 family)
MNRNDMSNYIAFDPDGQGLEGNIASISYDIDIIGQRFVSDNPKAPQFRLYAKSPRGKTVEIGGLWLKENQAGNQYYQMTVATGYGKYHANLGRFPGQDETSLMSVIPWD